MYFPDGEIYKGKFKDDKFDDDDATYITKDGKT